MARHTLTFDSEQVTGAARAGIALRVRLLVDDELTANGAQIPASAVSTAVTNDSGIATLDLNASGDYRGSGRYRGTWDGIDGHVLFDMPDAPATLNRGLYGSIQTSPPTPTAVPIDEAQLPGLADGKIWEGNAAGRPIQVDKPTGGPGGGGDFDLHDDVTTELAALSFNDRMLVSDESESGAPQKYVTVQTLTNLVRRTAAQVRTLLGIASSTQSGLMSSALFQKLAGIQSGAQVNPPRAGAFTAADEAKLDRLRQEISEEITANYTADTTLNIPASWHTKIVDVDQGNNDITLRAFHNGSVVLPDPFYCIVRVGSSGTGTVNVQGTILEGQGAYAEVFRLGTDFDVLPIPALAGPVAAARIAGAIGVANLPAVSAVGDPGSDQMLPTEQAVREALDAAEAHTHTGFRDVRNADAALTSADLGRVVLLTSGSQTITLPPPGAQVPTGARLWIGNGSSGTLTVAPSSGVTIDGPTSIATGRVVGYYLRAINSWGVITDTDRGSAPAARISELATTDAALNITSNTWTTVQSVTVAAAAGQRFSLIGRYTTEGISGTIGTSDARIRRSATDVVEMLNLTRFWNGQRSSCTIMGEDTPGAGSVTYDLQVRATTTVDVDARQLRAESV